MAKTLNTINPIKEDNNYRNFIQHGIVGRNVIFNSSSNVNYKVGKHSITMSSSKYMDGEEEFVTLDRKEFKFSKTGLTLLPEFLPFYMTMKEGCAKKLLMYILFHELEMKTCTFPFDDHVIVQFNNYCKLVNAPTYKEDVVKQAIRDIVDANLAISVKRKSYMINPIIVSIGSKSRWSLINAYLVKLKDKGKEIDDSFFPKYFSKI